MTLRVLITGFGPFPGAPFNPTEGLVHRLAARRRPAFADIARVGHVFRTAYAAVDEDLPELVAEHRPDVLLMFGLAARTPYVRIETRARNAVSVLVPDAGGRMQRTRGIRPGAVAALAGRAPFQKLLCAARTSRMPVRLSRDAGTYLCNYVYWRAIEARSRQQPIPLVAFIHVPRTWPGPRRPGRKRARTQEELARAGEAILLALVAAARAAGAGCSGADPVSPSAQRSGRRRR